MARVAIQRVLTQPDMFGSYWIPAVDPVAPFGVYTDLARTMTANVYQSETSTMTITNPIAPDTNGVIAGWLETPVRYYTLAGTVKGILDAVSTTALPVYNVRTYGAKGDGATDDTAAVQAAFAAAAEDTATIPPNSDNYGRHHIHFPAGTYRIRAAIIMMMSTLAKFAFGLRVSGAGMFETVIQFDPPTKDGSQYLFENNGRDGRGWAWVDFEEISFLGVKASGNPTPMVNFLRSGPSGAPNAPIQNYRFERCSWQDFQYGCLLIGVDNNDSWYFANCTISGDWNTFLWSAGSDQFVCFHLFGVHFEVNSGDFLRFDKGGNINIYGGSWLSLTGPTTFLRLLGAIHGEGTQRLYVNGVRIEFQTQNTKLISSEWGAGTISFDSLDMGSFSGFLPGGLNSHTAAQFFSSIFEGPTISWRSCVLMGKHEYAYATEVVPSRISYELCEHRQAADVRDFLVLNPSAAGYGAAAAAPLAVASATVTAAGMDYTTAPSVTFLGGDTSAPPRAIQATGHANVAGGAVMAVVIDTPGSGYSSPPTIRFGGPGNSATATAVMEVQAGNLPLASGGSGYGAPPAVTFVAGGIPDTTHPGTAMVVGGVVTAVTRGTYRGTGLLLPPRVLISSGGAKLGAQPQVSFHRCRGNGGAIWDQDAGALATARGESRRRVVSLKTVYGFNPTAGGSETVTLPLGVVVTGVRLSLPAGLGGAAANPTLVVQTGEGTPTVLGRAAPAMMNAGFSVETRLWFPLDSDAKRTLMLAANMNVDLGSALFVCLIEYVG